MFFLNDRFFTQHNMEKEGNKNTVILMRIEKIETFKYTLLDLLKFIEEKNANEWITSQTWVQIV